MEVRGASALPTSTAAVWMNPLAQQLAAEMRANGPLPFAEFMRRALYDPQYGYYNRESDQIGRRGDFFTSVSVGSFFGELLAFQFARWIEQLSGAGAVQIVEAGAHNGQLACDILRTLQSSEPALWRNLEYWIVEPSVARRAAQQAALQGFTNVRWFDSPEQIQARVTGVFFSNELLDAMPVQIFRWDATAHHWRELGVNVDTSGAFVWTPLATRPAVPSLPRELLDVLPDRYVLERSPAATEWWTSAARAVARGKLVTIDYGDTFEGLLAGRTSGTVRAYTRHRASDDVLQNPGEQDLTAHVNFSEIRAAGEAAGLATEAFTTQSQFLTAVARDFWSTRGSWPPHHVRQFQTLTHPEHLGRPFRVLVQGR